LKLKKERTIPAGDLKELESRLKYLQKVRGIGLIAGEPGCGISSLYYERHVTPVIILDEIHLVTNKILEDLRLLFNFKMDSQNPFILILAGQPLIRNKLALNVNNPLRQRLTVKYFMYGLKRDEIGEYCSSRLKSAGLHEEVFTPAVVEAIYGITKGLPRLVNNLVTTCLIIAGGKKQRQVDEDVVYQAQQELEILPLGVPYF
jgi:type II secretory pathway predicted ATPase ExeA